MRTTVDESLRREVHEFRLRYTCEHCAHFDGDRSTCAEGFPNDDHRSISLDVVCSIAFCKSFELA